MSYMLAYRHFNFFQVVSIWFIHVQKCWHLKKHKNTIKRRVQKKNQESAMEPNFCTSNIVPESTYIQNTLLTEKKIMRKTKGNLKTN